MRITLMKRHLLTLGLGMLGLLAGPDRGLYADEPRAGPRPLKIVVFGGHPDDPESGAGGLIGLLTQQGHEVIVAYGTAFRGDRRFFDRPEADVRRAEAFAACKVLGATPKFFPYAHEKLAADADTVKAVSDWFGSIKPDIVLTHWPLDTHPNHHVVSSLVWQSYAHQGGWSLYLFEVLTGQQTLGFEPELYLDIAAVRDIKRRALLEHRSQRPDSIWAAHERMHQMRGAECDREYAEAYRLVEAKRGCALLPVKFLARSNRPPAALKEKGAAGTDQVPKGRTLTSLK
jgi:LmbE family N-acetylglucosaminyl deacetylase